MALDEFAAFVARALFLDQPDPVALVGRAARLPAGADRPAGRRARDPHRGRGHRPDAAVKGRTWVNSDGRRNMPSGEVFTGPHEKTRERPHPLRRPVEPGGRPRRRRRARVPRRRGRRARAPSRATSTCSARSRPTTARAPRRARHRHELRHRPPGRHDPLRREDRRHRPPRARPLLSRDRRQERVRPALGPHLRPAPRRPDPRRRRADPGRRALGRPRPLIASRRTARR